MKVVVLTPIPTPYRDPFWSVVARQDGIDLTILYCAAGKADRPWQADWDRSYEYEVLPTINLLRWRGTDASCYWFSGIGRRLTRLGPDAIVVGGYNHPVMLAAMRWAVRRRVPYFLMSETYQRTVPNPLKRLVKRQLVNWVVHHMAGGFPTGRWAHEYLAGFGADVAKLTYLPNVPDVEFLHTQATALRHRQSQLRSELRLPLDRKIILFAGRLIPKKNADHLIRAFANSTIRDAAHLVVVGDGPLRAQLESLSVELGVTGSVHFAGFVQPSTMPSWFATSDLFVLPSAETWGVVVLEAVASGLPVVVSDQVGCQADVVTNDEIGDVFPLGNLQSLSESLSLRLATTQSERCKGESGNLLLQFRYKAVCSAFCRALNRLTSSALRINL